MCLVLYCIVLYACVDSDACWCRRYEDELEDFLIDIMMAEFNSEIEATVYGFLLLLRFIFVCKDREDTVGSAVTAAPAH